VPRKDKLERKHEAILSSLGERVRAQRHALGLTIAEVAEASSLSVRFVADLEAGRGNISVARLHDVADALEIDVAALLGRSSIGAHGAPRPRGVVALLGLRGAGKSTIGAKLAKRLRAPFVELDRVVEAAAGMSLGAVFELHGEPFYRRLEREALERTLHDHARAVVATGGSVVTDEETFALLRARATTVWLRASPESHWDRVVKQGDGRPMRDRRDAKSELRALLRQRESRYALADRTLDTDALGVDGVVSALAEWVGDSSEKR
jgi:XRE family aerobic/anaerobic benzoate catabolism transcriptional regulator